jgi:glycerol uptake facilitator-like aquaporin
MLKQIAASAEMKQKFLSEFLGSAFLLAIVVGSGIMGESLAQGNMTIALLANSLATGAGLYALIQCLGPISGAHFNPIVSLIEAFWGRLSRKGLILYWLAQFSGAVTGVLFAHIMFHQAVWQISTKDRSSANLWISEVIASFGLIVTIALAGRKRVEAAPSSMALYIVAAYWFTSSTSFANPAVTVARALTDTFCGIAPSGIFPFIVAQVIGSILAFLLVRRVK